jgi:asparagine synthase (glutamine-hydrolysing)
MCGIAGVFHYAEPNRSVDDRLVRAMTQALAHRGPDGEGVWSGPGVGLGHRRLAILDLSEHGRQPMVDPSGAFVVCYNGEIYNFRELRAQLEAKGHTFRSTGDTEVLLAGYAEWGREVVERLSGIFAFAIYDARQRALFLARDPLGIKPLFFALDERTFRFASEVKAILVDPTVDREPDGEALDAFFTFSYTPAPATGFRRVRQLLPGQAAAVSGKGLESWQYWSYPVAQRSSAVDFASALSEFGNRLDVVTRSQMVSDVGVGAFLSGGLDSAALVRAMKRVDDADVRALCVGFDVPGFDERRGARATAEALGVELTEIVLSVDATELVPILSRHLEEPTADSSALPVYLLCQAAAERFKVALSGDGADELLAGYETYRASHLAEWYRRVPKGIRRPVMALLQRVLPVRDTKYGMREMVTRFGYAAELGPGLDHSAWRVIFTDELKQRLYNPDFRALVSDQRALEAYAGHMHSPTESGSLLDGLLKADLEFYLPNDMLVKVDRMSMAHGLEVRVPFLDSDMVRYCASLPAEFKLRGGRVRKHILRESLRRSLPPSVLHAPKSGFNIPLSRWMRGDLSDLLLDTLASVRVDASRFLDVAEVQTLVHEHRRRRDDHAYALFTVLMFALWLENVADAWRFDA